MVDSSRERFSQGKFRSELKTAIPKLRSEDIEWIMASLISELQASRSAAIEDCAAIAKHEQRHWANPETETALLNVEGALRALKGEG